MRLAPLKPMPKTPMPYVPAAAARSGADDFAGAVAARAAQQAVKKEADALARMGANQAAKAAQNDAINVRAAGSVAARQAARQTAKREAAAQAEIAANQAARAAQNAAVNARQAGYYAREQAANAAAAANIANITSIPNKVLKHIINGEISGRNAARGHSILSNNVQIIKEGKMHPNGVYEADISIYNPKTGQYVPKIIKETPYINTMFPKTWTAERIKIEIDGAFQNRMPLPNKPNFGWQGISPSGVRIEGRINPKTGQMATAFPSINQVIP